MSEPAAEKKGSGWMTAAFIGLIGVGGGVAGTYATAVVNQVVKPTRPVANFSISTDGLTVSCRNHASGDSGWWDFGDGTPLEPFAAEKPIAHVYTKPGNFTIKLTVRNYFADENERSVPVEIATGVKDAPAPIVTGFAVSPVGSHSTAPATFRITADVAHADSCLWDFGDGRVEVTGGGKIDRMVTFDKPGTFAVQLFALTDKAAVKQATTVKVDAAPVGTLTAVLKVTDGGNWVVRLPRTESVAIPVPNVKNPQPFTKLVQARAGFTISDATLGTPTVPGVKNLKVAVAADKRSLTVLGEWAGDPKAVHQAAGGSDAIIPVKYTEERITPLQRSVTMVTGTLTTNGRCDLPLPPSLQGITGATREYQIEIRQTRATGPADVVARVPADGKGSAPFPWQAQAGTLKFGATLDANAVVVTATLGK